MTKMRLVQSILYLTNLTEKKGPLVAAYPGKRCGEMMLSAILAATHSYLVKGKATNQDVGEEKEVHKF